MSCASVAGALVTLIPCSISTPKACVIPRGTDGKKSSYMNRVPYSVRPNARQCGTSPNACITNVGTKLRNTSI